MEWFYGWGPAIAMGALMTLEVAVTSAVLGVLPGLVATLASFSRMGALRWLVDVYSNIMRGIPQLVLILLAYYGSTVALTRLAELLGSGGNPVEIPPLAAGIFALALIVGGYTYPIFRGAIQAIPKGQIEAAKAFGLTPWQVFSLISWPQLLRYALPGLGNVWISTLKDTSLIAVIGLEELTRTSMLATSDTRRALFFYLTAGGIYLAMTLISGLILARLEKRAARGARR